MMMGREAFISGWLLFGIILALTLYGVRKKLRTVPIGRASFWLNVHLYLGLVSTALFILHIKGQWPWGDFEVLLTLAFSTVLLSGLGGWLMNRVFAIRLGRRGTEVIYEHIPIHVHRLRQEAKAVMLQVAEETGSSTLPEFYVLRLARHFEGLRNRGSHIFGSAQPEVATGREITAVERYLDDREKRALATLAEFVKLKARPRLPSRAAMGAQVLALHPRAGDGGSPDLHRRPYPAGLCLQRGLAMTKPAGLEDFDFKHSHYERPSRGWMCGGGAAVGLEMPIGAGWPRPLPRRAVLRVSARRRTVELHPARITRRAMRGGAAARWLLLGPGAALRACPRRRLAPTPDDALGDSRARRFPGRRPGRGAGMAGQSWPPVGGPRRRVRMRRLSREL